MKASLCADPKYEGLWNLLQCRATQPICEKSNATLLVIRLAAYTQVESGTGKVIAEASRVEVMAMHGGSPIPSIISSLPLAAPVFEVPGLHTAGVRNLVPRPLVSDVPMFIAREVAHVIAYDGALMATIAEIRYRCDVSIYNSSSNTPL